MTMLLEPRLLLAAGVFVDPIRLELGDSVPWDAAVADLNGDGKSDLVVPTSSGISIFLGQGDGTFSPPSNIGLPNDRASIAAADFNGDGRIDLVMASAQASTMSVFLGSGDGTFQDERDFDVWHPADSVTTGDFNGDGKSDLATASATGNTVSILLGNGDGTFQEQRDFGAGRNVDFGLQMLGESTLEGRPLVTADFNGDGKTDVAVASAALGAFSSTTGTQVSILLGRGDGTFGAMQAAFASGLPGSMATGDVDGDGRSDLVLVDYSRRASPFAADVTVLLGQGDGTFDARDSFGVQRVPDTVPAPIPVPGMPSFWPGDTMPYPRQPVRVAVGDFSGDGKSDLVLASGNDNSVMVLHGSGNGTFLVRQDQRLPYFCLSSTWVSENRPAGTLVGELLSDAGNGIRYSIVSTTRGRYVTLGPSPDTPNDLFRIVGNRLLTGASMDYEAGDFDITIRGTDAAGQVCDRQFTISITNVNERPTSLVVMPPTRLALAPTLATGPAPTQPAPKAGEVLAAMLGTRDPDGSDVFLHNGDLIIGPDAKPFRYTLVAGKGAKDNALFRIAGNQLIFKGSLLANAQRTIAVGHFKQAKRFYTVRVRSTDPGGLFCEKSITIDLLPVMKRLLTTKPTARTPHYWQVSNALRKRLAFR